MRIVYVEREIVRERDLLVILTYVHLHVHECYKSKLCKCKRTTFWVDNMKQVVSFASASFLRTRFGTDHTSQVLPAVPLLVPCAPQVGGGKASWLTLPLPSVCLCTRFGTSHRPCSCLHYPAHHARQAILCTETSFR